VVVFRDEEGWRFGVASSAVARLCRLADGELEARDAGGVSVGEALAALAVEPVAAPAAREHVEVHVEQGPQLGQQDLALGR
jgi:hypothetical protein